MGPHIIASSAAVVLLRTGIAIDTTALITCAGILIAVSENRRSDDERQKSQSLNNGGHVECFEMYLLNYYRYLCVFIVVVCFLLLYFYEISPGYLYHFKDQCSYIYPSEEDKQEDVIMLYVTVVFELYCDVMAVVGASQF